MFSMADVAYNTASFGSLVKTLSQLVRISSGRSDGRMPLVLLGYKERDSAERELWPMLETIGITLAKVGEKAGAGGLPVEVWMGKPAAPAP